MKAKRKDGAIDHTGSTFDLFFFMAFASCHEIMRLTAMVSTSYRMPSSSRKSCRSSFC